MINTNSGSRAESPLTNAAARLWAVFAVMLAAGLPNPSWADTAVSGTLVSDATWTAAEGPYVLEGDVSVQNGASIRVEAGTTIYMKAAAGLRVQAGSLITQGTEEQPVRILSERERNGGTPAAGDWGALALSSGSSASILRHTIIRHGGGLQILSSSPLLNHVSIEHCSGPAIALDLAASPSGAGNKAAGNGTDAIVIPAGDIVGNVAWRVRGIPYLVSGGTVSVGASPSITNIFPSTIERGETATITLSGTRLNGLSGASFSSAGVSAQILAGGSGSSASLSVTAEADATVGPAGMKLLVDAGEIDLPTILAVNYALPQLSSLNPATIYAGQGEAAVEINGRNFTADSRVMVDGSAAPASLVSSTKLNATVPAQVAPRSLGVKVRSPHPVEQGEYLLSNELLLTVAAPTLALAPTSISIRNGVAKNLTLNLPFVAGQGGQVVNLVSSVPSIASVPSLATVPEGASSVLVPVSAASLGATTITASKAGFGNAQAQVTVIPPPTLTISPASFTMGVGRSVSLTLTSSIAAPAEGLTVTLGNSGPSVVTLPASAIIPAGATTAVVTATTTQLGSATVTAQADEYVGGTASFTVRPASLNFGTGALVAPGLSRSLPITLSDPAPAGGLTIQLVSSNPAVLAAPASVQVAEGETAANAVVNGISAGATTLTASAEGYEPGQIPVTVEAVSISLGVSSISVPEAIGQSYTVSLSRPAPAGGVTVSLATANPATATVSPVSVLIPEGQTSGGLIRAQVSGVARGSTTLSAGAPGLNAASVPVNVTGKVQLGFGNNGGGTAVRVGKGLSSYYAEVYVNRKTDNTAYAPNTAVVINLTSSDPSKLSVPATVTIPASESSAYFTVTGVDLTGSTPVMIDASVEGYASPITKITGHTVLSEFILNSLETSRSPASGRDNVSVKARTPGSTYSGNETVVASMTIDLSVVEANPAGIVEGIYSAATGGTLVTQVTIPAGAHTSETVHVGVPTAAGSYKLRAESANYGSTTSGIVTVTQPQLRFGNNGGGTAVRVGKGLNSYYAEVYVQRIVNGQAINAPTPLTVSLSSSDPSKLSVPATVTIPANENSVYFTVTGVDLTASTPVTVDASAEGYASPVTKMTGHTVSPEFLFNGLETSRSPESGRDSVSVKARTPGSTYSGNETVVASMTVDLSVVEANPAGIVDGIYSAATGGTLVTQVTIPAGTHTSNTVHVGVPTTAGSYKLRAESASHGSTNSGVVTVTQPQLRFGNNGGGTAVRVGKGLNSYYAEVYVQRIVNGQAINAPIPLTVSLTSSDPSKLSVPATVTIPANDNSAYFTVTGVDLTGSTPVTIDASAAGYASPVTKITGHTVSPEFLINSLEASRSPASTRDNISVKARTPGSTYSGNETAVASMTVDLSVVEANPAGIVDGIYSAATGGAVVTQVTIPAGAHTSNTVHIGVPTTAGSYKLRAEVLNLGNVTSGAVTVTTPSLRLGKQGSASAPVYVGQRLKTYQSEVYVERTVNGQVFNGTAAIDIVLQCSSEAICKVPPLVTIPAGQSSVYFRVEGMGVGTTTISATAVGYNSSPELNVQGVLPVLEISQPANLRVGTQSNFNVSIKTPNSVYSGNETAAVPIAVDLTSSAPDVATVPATITIPAGVDVVNSIKLTAYSVGSTSVTASGPDMTSATTGTITVNP